MGTYWNTAPTELGAEVAGAPFAPGDLILHRRDPREAWVVERVELTPRGDRMVHYGVGNVTGSAPAHELLAKVGAL